MHRNVKIINGVHVVNWTLTPWNEKAKERESFAGVSLPPAEARANKDYCEVWKRLPGNNPKAKDQDIAEAILAAYRLNNPLPAPKLKPRPVARKNTDILLLWISENFPVTMAQIVEGVFEAGLPPEGTVWATAPEHTSSMVNRLLKRGFVAGMASRDDTESRYYATEEGRLHLDKLLPTQI